MHQYRISLNQKEEKDFFRDIYESYKDELYHTAYGIVKNDSDAEDIVHETFEAVIPYLGEMMKDPPQKNWNFLITILKNKCYNLCKKNNRESDSEAKGPEEELALEYCMDTKMEQMEKKELLLTLIKQLKKSYQDVLILQYYHEKDIFEIAEIMGKTPDNVRHISMRAKKKLQKLLEKHGVSDSYWI